MKHDKACCPELIDGKQCDYLDFVYRLKHYTDVNSNNRGRRIAVEVAMHIRVERCTGPFQLGNLIYSTTLLPGEKVRLYTQDRKTRWSYDAESQLSYRHEQKAEEQYYMDSFEKFMSDLESRETVHDSSSSSGEASSKGSTSGPFDTLFNGPSVSVSGSYNAQSTRDFMRELNVHAESSHNRSVQMTREATATQIGEVQTRQHAEGESESHFESSSRTFENKNQCHSVSYLFYQVDKVQTTKVTIQAVRTRVIDPAADSSVVNRPVVADRKLSVIPTAILATSEKAKPKVMQPVSAVRMNAVNLSHVAYASINVNTQPISDEERTEALNQVHQDLVRNKIIDKNGKVTDELTAEMNFSFKTSIPTPGIVVKGCLDDCNTCEEAQQEKIKLELEHKKLKNKLLARQIELLENAQEYRCCPVGMEELEPEEA
ncbi:hypothetical protein [Pleionea mediterranea]|uniref:Uncharacterized protein n=1 Tax=Pleionea mediterranea TaxID=523701 RepID=A0A316FPX4_9GAMM|nr:hypothetical protein [Pleionea mediterranea]PWK50831.1 hypothetical protein C8D97_106118 [Pleionea mediterranea]